MVLIDTSVWINVFKDNSGIYSQQLQALVGEEEIALTRFQQLELLQGVRDEKEWILLSDYLDNQLYLEVGSDTWQAAARIYFDLRRSGVTVRSPIDCCIAQIAIENEVLLIHDDRDFEVIAGVVGLVERRFPV
jgi:predicted nucleic acid-binding protein